MAARFSLFYMDIVLIAGLTLGALVMRRVELDVLVQLKVFKDLDEMNDREMFVEYEKMRKQSMKVKEKYSEMLAEIRLRDHKRYSINEEEAGEGGSSEEADQQ